MTTQRRTVGNIPLPRPLRKPREQVPLDLNQNVLETFSSRAANVNKTSKKKSSSEHESPIGGEDISSKSDDVSNDFDEKCGHVIFKGSLRPNGTRRKDRILKSEKYVLPFRRDQKVENNPEPARKISSLIQEPENKAAKKNLSIENAHLTKRESPEGRKESSLKSDQVSNASKLPPGKNRKIMLKSVHF